MSDIRMLVFGPAEFIRDGRLVELSAAKAVALLAYLAVRDMPQTRDHLTDVLWPDSLPDAARKNLRNTLWTIRKVLGDDVLTQSDADHLTLSGAVWVDVRVFEATAGSAASGEWPSMDDLQEAIDLYRAPLLNGLVLSGVADFEIWLSAERERFGGLYVRALEVLIGSHRSEAVAVYRHRPSPWRPPRPD